MCTLIKQLKFMIELTTSDIVLRIVISICLGMILGLERTLAGKTAGMRTYSMVALGSAVFILTAELVKNAVPSSIVYNPLSVAAAVITGIGFIGAGLVIFQSNKIIGLTTAAGLWVSAGIGITVGFGLFNLAVIATVASLIIFTLMWFFEEGLKKFSYKPGTESITKVEEDIKEQEEKFFTPKQ